ncbi:alpha/beta fold hydrolase [Aureimonas mangrovi]|uniref:alpha/beta fold hydrolase n=1 Tax=Aureimonas mangrovi TaxID=2758041 RepID=UPI001AEE901B|nr:alpha/beta hydrolase [Aureimonas mangrovi]
MLTADSSPSPQDAPEFADVAGNPRPERLEGGWFGLRGGKRLRYAIVEPERASRGTVLLLQGRNEAIEKYFETISDLTARGFTVAIFDWRGQGGSDRMVRNRSKGHIDSVRTYVRDLEAFTKDVVLPRCPAPRVILAHSLGGLVALRATPRLAGQYERMVLSAPLVALRPPMSHLYPLTQFMRWIGLGRVPLRRVERSGARASLARNPLTSDRARFERNRAIVESAPELFVTSLTAGWLAACMKAARRLDDSDAIAKLHTPTLFVTAGEDRVVDSRAASRLAWRMRSGHAIDLPGARHELLQEADEHRELFLAAFEAFVGSLMPEPAEVLGPPPEALAEALEAAVPARQSEPSEAPMATSISR